MNAEHETEILLVEDNPHDAELAMIALRARNLANKVVHVRDGAEALDFLFCTGSCTGRSNGPQPKVVLLDLKLPKVDGLEVLRAIKTNPKTKMIPVVVMTSSEEQRDLVDSYQLGVNSYIVKPVDFDNFSAAVAELGCYWLLLNKIPPGSADSPRPAH